MKNKYSLLLKFKKKQPIKSLETHVAKMFQVNVIWIKWIF